MGDTRPGGRRVDGRGDLCEVGVTLAEHSSCAYAPIVEVVGRPTGAAPGPSLPLAYASTARGEGFLSHTHR